MFHEKIFPYMKAFEGSDGKIYYITYYADGHTDFHIEHCPGKEIIDFCELDLSEYENKLYEFKNMEYSFLNYEALKNYAWGIADILKEKHPQAYFFTSHNLSNILSRPITEEESNSKELLDRIYRQDIEDSRNILEEVIILYEIFREAIKLCLDKENLKSRHISEKLIGFLYKYPQFNDFVLQSGYALMPNIDGRLDYETVKAMNENNITDTGERLRIMHKDGKTLSLMNYSNIEKLSEFFYYEFMQIMKSGRRIKVCKNCGKYFVLKDNRGREYCDRIFKGDKTCRDIGAAVKYKSSLEDVYLKTALGVYNKMYSRMSRALDKLPDSKSEKNLTEEEFNKWSKIYSKAKKEYISKAITGDELLKIINTEK